MKELTLDGETVRLYGEGELWFFLNTFSGEGGSLWGLLSPEEQARCTLIEVCPENWDGALSPWPAAALREGDAPFAGEAPAQLEFLLRRVLPAAEAHAAAPAAKKVIAGYSLAGLFALWALYETDAFDAAAGVSASFWYPDFLRFATQTPLRRAPDCLYLSLGDRECRTRHPLLCAVQENGEALVRHWQAQGLDAVFELNPGSHTKNANGRTAKALRHILSRCAAPAPGTARR